MENTLFALSSAFGGSIVGALIGGTISYMLQKQALKAAAEERSNERHEKDKSLGYSLFSKLIRLYSNIVSLENAIDESFRDAKKQKFKAEPWQIVVPIANLPDTVRFSDAERTFLLGIDFDLFNDLGPFDAVHNSLIRVASRYNVKREQTLQPLSAKMDGYLGTSALTEEEYMRLQPRTVELNQLVELMRQQAKSDGTRAWKLALRLHRILNKDYGLKAKLVSNKKEHVLPQL